MTTKNKPSKLIGEKVYLVHGHADVWADALDAYKAAMKWIEENKEGIKNPNDRQILEILMAGPTVHFDIVIHFYNNVCPEGAGISVSEQEIR